VINYEQIMQDLADFLGLSGLVLAASGNCTLVFDDVYVQFSAPDLGDAADAAAAASGYAASGHATSSPNASIGLRSRVGMSNLDDTHQQEQFLQFNLPGHGAAGISLGVSPAGEVVLSRAIPLQHLNLERFTEYLELFVNVAEHWQKTLASDAPGGQALLMQQSMDASMRA